MRVRVIDIETTGDVPPAAAICEIGWCDVVSTDTDSAGKPTAWVADSAPLSMLVNPGHPMPAEVSAIHHIIDEDLTAAPTIAIAGPTIFGPDVPVDALCAHQAKFERAFITDEMTGGKPWVCTYRCALRLWRDAPAHSNQALRYWRKPSGLQREIATPAHRAGPDAYVTAHHLRDMLNGGALLEHMITRSSQPALLVRCRIGQHRGKLWSEVDTGFLQWMLDKDFGEDEIFTAWHWINARNKAAAKKEPV